jgi:hypothetical protein
VITDEAAGEFIQALSVFCFVLKQSPEKLYIFTDKGKLSFVQDTEVRKDEL